MDADPAEREHRLVVDRREGDRVVVEVDGGGTLDLPRWLLPPGVREGDVIRASGGPDQVTLRVDRHATDAARADAAERLKRLRARDPGGDIEL